MFQGRLVDKDGIIYQDAFYNYLTAWAAIDALAYYSSDANLQPMPRDWYYIKLPMYTDFHNVTESDVKSKFLFQVFYGKCVCVCVSDKNTKYT